MYGKNCAVKKSDYENYSINLPFKFLLGKRRKKFIFKELEKLHPCFSDEYCFDSKILYKNWKFFADVLVMNKMKLASYRFDNPRCKLHTEENEKKLIFVEKKKYIHILCSFLFVFFILGIVFLIHFRNEKKLAMKKTEIVEKEFKQNEVSQNRGDACKLIFDAIDKCDGKISNFSFENSSFSENVIVSVNDIFAEEILGADSKIEVSSISYLNNVPNLRLHHSSKTKQLDIAPAVYSDYLAFLSKFRSLLINSKCKIVEENNNPFTIRFSFEIEQFEELFNKIAALFNVELFFCPTLSITKGQVFTVYLKIENALPIFSNGKENNSSINSTQNFNVFAFLAQNKKLFFTRAELSALSQKEKLLLQNQKQKQPSKIYLKNVKQNASKNNDKIVGKIKNKDGTSNVFYKSNNKKIYMIKEEVVNENE